MGVRYLQVPRVQVPKDLGLSHHPAVCPLVAYLVVLPCVPQFPHL